MVFWVGLSNCFLFVLLNSQHIFEMVMPVQHAAKVYKSIWDVFSTRVFWRICFFHRFCRRHRRLGCDLMYRDGRWSLVCVNLNTLNGNDEASEQASE